MEKILGLGLFISLFSVAYNAHANPLPLRIPLHAAKISLNPSNIQDVSSLFVSRQVNCQLVRSYGSVVKLDAAESVRYITPNKIRITIKKNAFFQDGSPITAEDISASLDHLIKSRPALRNIFTWIKKIGVQDKSTIIITLTKPIPQFLSVLSSPSYAIFKKTFLDKAKTNPAMWKKPIGCGKYKITEFKKDIIKLSPIHHGRPIEFYLNQDDQIISADLSRYDIIDLHLHGNLDGLFDFRSIEIFDPTQIYLGMNTKISPWNNRAERCAFFARLRPDKIIKQYGMRAKPTTDILPEGVLGYRDTHLTVNELYNKYMARPVPHKNTFCLTYLTVSIPKDLRPAYQEMISAIYPLIQPHDLTSNKRFGQDFIQSKCDAIVVGIKSNTLDGYDLLAALSSPAANFTGFDNKILSKKIEESQNESDPKLRSALYRYIVSQIEDDCILYPIITIPTKRIYIRKGLHTPNIGKGPLNEYDLSEVI